MRTAYLAMLLVFGSVTGILAADEGTVRLKEGKGLDKVQAHCSACHSLDYVGMNSPFLDANGWNAEIAKMINVFGAPIDQADAKAIADYLNRNYGPQIEARQPTSRAGAKRISKPSSPRNVSAYHARPKQTSLSGPFWNFGAGRNWMPFFPGCGAADPAVPYRAAVWAVCNTRPR
jgi:sulfite dehydrogenase (cytochrome) subunit B